MPALTDIAARQKVALLMPVPCATGAAGLSTAVGGLRFRPGPLVATWKGPKQWLVLEGPRWA